MTIYGTTFNPMVSLKALTYFEDGDVKELDAEARHLLEKAAVAVDIRTLYPFPASTMPFDVIDSPANGQAPGRVRLPDMKP